MLKYEEKHQINCWIQHSITNMSIKRHILYFSNFLKDFLDNKWQ